MSLIQLFLDGILLSALLFFPQIRSGRFQEIPEVFPGSKSLIIDITGFPAGISHLTVYSPRTKARSSLTLSVQIKYAYANHSLLALGAPGKTQVSRISCFDDYPLPVHVSKSGHIGQGRSGTDTIREASSMEKPSGTPRSGTIFIYIYVY